jgi:hypothetical protein
MSLYPLALNYGGCIDNSLAYASTPRLHYFCNDSVIGFLLAASVFSYPDSPAFTPALYKGCQSFCIGETRLLWLFVCFQSRTTTAGLVYFGLGYVCQVFLAIVPVSPGGHSIVATPGVSPA